MASVWQIPAARASVIPVFLLIPSAALGPFVFSSRSVLVSRKQSVYLLHKLRGLAHNRFLYGPIVEPFVGVNVFLVATFLCREASSLVSSGVTLDLEASYACEVFT